MRGVFLKKNIYVDFFVRVLSRKISFFITFCLRIYKLGRINGSEFF